MTGIQVTLRSAVPDDAAAAAALHRNCWREAYSPLVDPGLLQARLADAFTWVKAWQVSLAAGEPRVLAETEDGELIGFARAGTSRDEPAVTELELYAIYVREEWYGTGVGQALFETVVGNLPVSAWVLEHNARALGFYARNGLHPDGARKRYDALDAWEVRVVRP